ncbi:MAG: hypothetical protein AB7O65_04590, partial [Candidatus Korobacteraceae bacterium]
MKQRLQLLACVAAFLCTLPAHAQFQLGAYVGAARTGDSSLFVFQPRVTSLEFRGVQYRDRSFEWPLYYGVRGAYFPGERFGFEAEFIHMKVHAATERTVQGGGTLNGSTIQHSGPLSDYVQRFSISHGLNMILGNLVIRQEFFRNTYSPGWLIVSGRVGLGGTISHAETEIFGVVDQGYQSGGGVVQLAIGPEMRLWRNLHLL